MTYVKFNQPHSKTIDGFVNGFLNDLPSMLGKSYSSDSTIQAPANIIESKENYKIELAVPGRNKEDFKIQIDKNLLNVSFEKKNPTLNENEKVIRSEFSFNSFKRTFTLDDKVDAEKISAKYENGILILNIPKKEELVKAPKEIEIQ